MNPLLNKSHDRNNYIPFDTLTVNDYEEAIIKGIQAHNEEIDDIVNNTEVPSFDNTIEALEYSGELLDKSSTVFFNLLSAETNDEMDCLAEKISPVLSEHSNSILHNTKLFEKVKYVYNHYNTPEELSLLNTEQQTLLKNTFDYFVRNGADLEETTKAKLAQLKKELAVLTIKFSQNHLKDLNSYSLNVTDSNDVEGLPQTVLNSAKADAVNKNLEGWLFSLQAPSYGPFMTYCRNRDLRKEIYMAYNTLCTHDNDYNNLDIVRSIVNKKREVAQLLGYTDYAEYVLVKRMAENKHNVYTLLEELITSYMPQARIEVSDVESFAKAIEGDSFNLMPWDYSYYSNLLKEQRYNINSETVRPYFPLDKVKDGIFGLAEQLYDISFKRNTNIPVFHKDVETYEVYDSEGEFMALLYCDFFPRSTKKSGAWMTSYQDQYRYADGKKVYPQVSITTNFTRPTDDTPSLLTLSELETFLHEFGHALHGMLSDVTYKSLSGTNVYWDFVELPSQIMENFSLENEFLDTFAYHYTSQEKIPSEIIANIQASRNFNVAYSCMRQVSFALLDMNLYSRNDEFTDDIMNNEKTEFDKVRLLPYIEGTCMTTQFAHIMSGGYSAGYYSYKWAEVLDADAFSLFKEQGVFNKDVANSFRQNILSRGGTEHPMTLYKRFRGKEPTINALLVRNGIVK